ncbi:hypothetical protein B0H11DRAFT_2256787 [Mycena galericulata]|nr:hypothetical protein B0H11DRAFT_2256787 [Mycena galericulata]
MAVDSSFGMQCTTAAETPAQISTGLSEDEHSRNCAFLDNVALRREEKTRARRHLQRYNSLGAAWERYHVYSFLRALQLAMALQTAIDADAASA